MKTFSFLPIHPLAFILVLTLPVAALPAEASAQTWSLVWSDEFDSAGISPANWTYDTGGNGWGNNELEYYTNRPENATTAGGNLLIIARQESFGGRNYTSARLTSQGLRSFTYGRIEARMKLPLGQGTWPAFWMLGTSITQVGWPQCGEIDVMEHINSTQNIYGTMHWDNNGHASYGGQIVCNDVRAFHVYAIEWNANAIRWFLDGAQYREGNITGNINSTQEFHAPFFLLLNCAVGGNWPGNPDTSSHFPDTVAVDYVRVYQLSTGVREETGEAGGFGFLESYPNPFNASTTISFELGSDARTTLVLYDLLGRTVDVLCDDRLATGRHAFRWDAAGAASGTYICRLTTPTHSDARMLTLLK